MGKGSYQGGSSLLKAEVGFVSGQTQNLSPRPETGPTRRQLERQALRAEQKVKALESKLTKLKNDLRQAEKARQDVHAQLKSKSLKR